MSASPAGWQAEWSDRVRPAPGAIVVADDTTSADAALRTLRAGTALRWDGDFPTARRVLAALERRLAEPGSSGSAADLFRAGREARSRLVRATALLVVRLDAEHRLDLPRAPDTREACDRAWGPADGPSLVPLRELLGVLSADEWRRRGIEVPALGARIHPHYGVFAPTRQDYVRLVAEAPLPDPLDVAFDVGTGTGLLAALLARRGARSVVATDVDDRAVACATENVQRLDLAGRVDVVHADLYPPGRADLVVGNPPWLPGRPHSSLDGGVYDPGGRVLRAFLDRMRRHLRPGGEGWLVLSDLAERIGLRAPDEVPTMIARAGLVVRDTLTTPTHRGPADVDNPLAAARAAETVVLRRLGSA